MLALALPACAAPDDDGPRLAPAQRSGSVVEAAEVRLDPPGDVGDEGDLDAPGDGESQTGFRPLAAPVDGKPFDSGTYRPRALTGETRMMKARLPWGVADVRVTRVGERWITEGDIVVATVGDRVLRSAAMPDLSKRWPATIAFDIDTSALSEAEEQEVRAALDLIQQRSPQRFVERTSETDYLRFIRSDIDNVSFSPIGKQGGKQEIGVFPDAERGVIAHEVLHSLGMWHEQSRPHRDDVLDLFTECMDQDFDDNYDAQANALELGDYDFASIMHYGSDYFCVEDTADADGDGIVDECGFKLVNGQRRVCLPMENTSSACPLGTCVDKDGDGVREFIKSQRERLSNTDINSVYLLYGLGLGANEVGDLMGSAVATGDFDADGFDDLAVGMPGEAPDSDPKSGVVLLYKGTASGLAPWKLLSQETEPVQADGMLGSTIGINEVNDRFGASLAVGDFNHDGIDDLAVGAPGEDRFQLAGAGAVYVYLGFANVIGDPRHGLQAWDMITQETGSAGASEINDVFGSALAVGDFDGDGRDDLAVGAPGEAPTGEPQSGFVYVFRGSSTTLTRWRGLRETSLSPLANGERFGAALAAGDWNADGKADLAVGAPRETRGGLAGAGAVFLFKGGAVEPSAWILLDAASLSTLRANAELGTALASGDVNGDGVRDLVIGAPGHIGGRVHIFRGVTGGTPAAWRLLSQVTPWSDEAGDRFGQALAVGDLNDDGIGDVLIGGPNERQTGPAAEGFLYVFRGAATGPTVLKGLNQDGVDPASDSDFLGAAVAIGDFDGNGRFEAIGGMPGNLVDAKDNAGGLLVGKPWHGDVWQRSMIVQTTKALHAK